MDSPKSTEEARVRLVQLIREKSYREGDFTLASGKKSTFYIDLKASTLHPVGAHLIGYLGFQLLQSAEIEVEAVGGLTLGADPIATAVSLAALEGGKIWPAFIVRKESKGHGTLKFIEGTENLKPGAKVAVMEDVVTTGGSALQAVEKLRAEGYVPTVVLGIVDRNQGGREAIEKAGLRLLPILSLAEIQAG